MSRFRLRIMVAAIAATVALTGCSTMSQINRQSIDQYAQVQRQSEQRLAALERAQRPAGPIMSNMPYVNTVPVTHSDKYPELFYGHAALNSPAEPVWRLMRQIQEMTGISVVTDDDIANGGGGGSLPPAPAGGLDATLAPPAVGEESGAESGRAVVSGISYSGTVKGLLDTITGHMDATWSYNADTRTIHVFRYETRSFPIATVPGDATSSSDVGSGAGTAVTGGQGQTESIKQSKSDTTFDSKLSVWKTLQDNVKPMLSRAGTLTISEPTASITVRDRWDRVAAIARYIKQVNASLGTEVQVNVSIYRVHAGDADNRGINWSILYNALGQAASTAGLAISSARPTATGLSSLILNTPTTRPDGSTPPFAGSQFFLDALSTIGRTSEETNATIDTVNNTPAPYKVIQTTAYVAQTTSLLTTGTATGGNGGVVGAGATLTPGSVETGFTMQILPSVQEDGQRMLLQVMLSLSTLDSLPTFTSGGSSVQLPQVSSREIMNRAWMKSGQSLVLAGFRQTEGQNTTETALDKTMWLLGGNRNVNNTHDALVIVITPVATASQTTL
jgi:type IVB pilus formation R64 PilN family outer membrane protein